MSHVTERLEHVCLCNGMRRADRNVAIKIWCCAELVSATWHKGDVEITQSFWHRPLGDVFSAFADAGFAVDRISETRPSAQALRRFPQELTPTASEPSFIVYRLWRRP